MINNKTPYGAMLEKIIALSPFQVDWSRITVIMAGRLRTTGGMSVYNTLTRLVTIKLNAELFGKLTPAQQYEILAHEMAHAILQLHNIFDKHGYQWQNLHRKLGGTAERCHHHEVTHNLRRRVVIRSQKNGACVLITLQRWNKLKPALDRGAAFAYDFVGVISCDLNSRTYRWETLRFPELRETPLIKNLKLAA